MTHNTTESRSKKLFTKIPLASGSMYIVLLFVFNGIKNMEAMIAQLVM